MLDSALKEDLVKIIFDQDVLCFKFSGELNFHNVGDLWKTCFDTLKSSSAPTVILDCEELSACDSAGINLLLGIQAQTRKEDQNIELLHLKPQLAKLIQNFNTSGTPKKPITKKNLDLLSQLGQNAFKALLYFRKNLSFMGEIIFYLLQTLAHPRKMRWRDAWRLLENTGPNALPIIALVGFLIGMIMGFQGAMALEKFGAKLYVPNFVGITLLRELAPLLTAIMVIGRSASAFAAELGSMQLNQEVDALRTMGIEVTQFLVIPRVFASMLMLPILNIFMIIFGLVGCGVVTHMLGISVPLYINQLADALTLQDFLGGMFKSVVFGIVVASIGCMHGLRTSGGAVGVGASTTQTVVSGIVMLTVIDGIFSILFYSLNL